MQLVLPEWSEYGMNAPMALQSRQPCERCGHDPHPKVPSARRPRVTGVRRAVVADLEPARLQLLAQQLLDASSGVAHVALGLVDSIRAASHALCASANTSSAALRPKTLNSTQACSLIERATSRLRPPSSA